MKILLAYQSGLPHRKDPYISLIPTGLCYLHACLLKAGHESTLANFSAWPAARIRREVKKMGPDFVGISQWTHNRHASMELARLCRSLLPHGTIIMGGGHATFCYKDILTEDSPVDVVVLGEGEATLLEIVRSTPDDWRNISGAAFRHNGTIVVTPARAALDDLDLLPVPARYLERSIGLDLEMQAEFIVTTRGCPSACHFCSSPAFWGRKVRFRSPEAIIDEITYIRQKLGLIYFSIRDDTFTADRNRVLEFCALLQQRKLAILWNCQSRVTAIDEELLIAMKMAGCECIQLGVESGSPRLLKQLGKKITPAQIEHAASLIRRIGINLSIYLISDVPGENSEDTRQTVDLIRHIHPDDGYVSPLAYFPGTQLYKEAVSSGSASAGIFIESKSEAIFAAVTSGTSSSQLMKALTSNRQSAPDRFRRQKQMLGFCFTTNVIAAEWYCSGGEYEKAEEELLEITAVQPDNPWGWFLLGDLYSDRGDIREARRCYRTVLNIVPQHNPSRSALQQI